MEQRYKNLDFGDLFVTSFKGFFSNIGGFMAIVVMNLIPLLIMIVSAIAFIGMATLSVMFGESNYNAINDLFTNNPGPVVGGMFIVLGLTVVASIVFGPAAFAANSKLFEQYYLGERMSFSEAFSYGFSKWTNTFVTGLLVALINFGLTIGFALLGTILIVVQLNPIITGLILGLAVIVAFGFMFTKLAFAMPLTVLQGNSPGEAIGNSFEMTKGRFWMVFGYILGGTILIGIITGIPSMIFSMMPVVSTSIRFTISLFSGIFVTNFMTGLFIRVWEEDHPVENEVLPNNETEASVIAPTSDDIQF